MDDAIVRHVVETVSAAAALAAVNMLQQDRPLGYATLDSQAGDPIGVVVVCLNPSETTAMLAYIRGRGRQVVIGRLE